MCRLGRGLRLTRLYLLYLWLCIGYRLYLHFITIGKSDFVEGGGSEAVAASGVGMSGKQNRGPIQVLIVVGGGGQRVSDEEGLKGDENYYIYIHQVKLGTGGFHQIYQRLYSYIYEKIYFWVLSYLLLSIDKFSVCSILSNEIFL